MADALEALFVEQLPTIRRLAAVVARRHGLAADDIEEWTSWLTLRLVENGYAALAKYRGESSLTTYLAVVVAMAFRDYRVQRWGRWRPSAAALRAGALAVRLERLVRRDEMTLAEAGELLRTRGETTLADRELARVLARLPQRDPLRPVEVGGAPLDLIAATAGPDAAVEQAESDEEAARTARASAEALSTLPPEDQVIVRLRFYEGLSVADVARALGVEQKPLYRRLERTLAQLRSQLERRGIGRAEARTVLDEAGD